MKRVARPPEDDEWRDRMLRRLATIDWLLRSAATIAELSRELPRLEWEWRN